MFIKIFRELDEQLKNKRKSKASLKYVNYSNQVHFFVQKKIKKSLSHDG